MAISLHVNDFSFESRTPTLHESANPVKIVQYLEIGRKSGLIRRERQFQSLEKGDLHWHQDMRPGHRPGRGGVAPRNPLQLCFVGQDCQRIPSILGATYGLQTKRLDLSYNSIRSLDGLNKFPFLEELILDNNYLDDSVIIPRLHTLNTFSLNKNKITNLEKLVEQIKECLPNLRYLSLLGNEACPDQLSSADKDEKDYRRYRLYVLNRLPTLKFLDSTGVRRSEMREARKRGALARTIRPPPLQVCPPPLTKMRYDGMGGSLLPTEGNRTAKRNPVDRRELNGTVGKRGISDTLSPMTHTGAYGIRQYRYLGQHSEGNRFINNEAL